LGSTDGARILVSGDDEGAVRVGRAGGGEPHLADLSNPPLQTNSRGVEDAAAATGYKLDIGPFPGWKDVPTW
jgi:hypothetical protein